MEFFKCRDVRWKGTEKRNKPNVVATTTKHPDSRSQISRYGWQPRLQGSLLSCAGNRDPWPGPTTFGFWMALWTQLLRPEPIRFVRLYSGNAQSDESPWIGPGQRSRSPSCDQKDRGLWERDCTAECSRRTCTVSHFGGNLLLAAVLAPAVAICLNSLMTANAAVLYVPPPIIFRYPFPKSPKSVKACYFQSFFFYVLRFTLFIHFFLAPFSAGDNSELY